MTPDEVAKAHLMWRFLACRKMCDGALSSQIVEDELCLREVEEPDDAACGLLTSARETDTVLRATLWAVRLLVEGTLYMRLQKRKSVISVRNA